MQRAPRVILGLFAGWQTGVVGGDNALGGPSAPLSLPATPRDPQQRSVSGLDASWEPFSLWSKQSLRDNVPFLVKGPRLRDYRFEKIDFPRQEKRQGFLDSPDRFDLVARDDGTEQPLVKLIARSTGR